MGEDLVLVDYLILMINDINLIFEAHILGLG